MPELPEVEVVRSGLQRWVAGRTIDDVEVRHPRAVRRHVAGPGDFATRLRGRTIACVSRRGKYLWLPLSAGGQRPDTAAVGTMARLSVRRIWWWSALPSSSNKGRLGP